LYGNGRSAALLALRRRKAGQHLPGHDGVARLDQHLRNLQPFPVRPYKNLIPRDHDTGDLKRVGEADIRGPRHGDRHVADVA
jgi:hypothetical protein